MDLPIDEDFDVAVIGGGIHGAGVAQAAAAAGYHTLLVERDDWAAATSRHSSKLVHGGLRYLETAQFRLVRHSLTERQRLLANAPELVRPVPFHIPIYRDTRRRAWQIRTGLTLYALLTGLHPLSRFRRLPRTQWNALGGLRQEGLEAVFQYWDAQTDDAALTRAVVASAARLGARCLQHSELLAARRDGQGYTLKLRSSAQDWFCHCRTLVDAAGPWVNEVLSRCEPAPPPRPMSWVKGSHILLPAGPLPGIFYLEAPSDQRAVFVMPWRGYTLVGTTEVEVDSPHAVPSPAEIDYLLATLRHYFPDHPCTLLDSFAGVRVLPAATGDDSPFRRARDSVVHEAAPGLFGIYGGKLTTYRHTAQRVLAGLSRRLGPRSTLADTRSLALPPAPPE